MRQSAPQNLELVAAEAYAAYEDEVATTPRTKNRREEVDAYENPTELFQWINYGNYQSAAIHVLEYPEEASTWIVSRSKDRKETTKWRYLPLHLVCMKPNPSPDLVRALLFTYQSGARQRDYDGNLPIHYLLQEGNEHVDVLKMLLKAYPSGIQKRDRKGRSALEIVSDAYRDRKIEKNAMVAVLDVLRQFDGTDESSGIHSAPLPIRSHQYDGNDRRAERRDSFPPQQAQLSVSFDAHEAPTPKTKQRKRRSRSRDRDRDRSRSSSRTRGGRQDDHLSRKADSKGRSSSSSRKRTPRSSRKKSSSSQHQEQNDNRSMSLEDKLEDTLAERDILRQTVSKLTEDHMNHEMALASMSKQISTSSSEITKGNDKIKKKNAIIEDLESLLDEKKRKISNLEENLKKAEQAIAKREQDIAKREEELSELQETVEDLEEHNEAAGKYAEKLKCSNMQNEDLHKRIEEMEKIAVRTAENHRQELEMLQGRANDVVTKTISAERAQMDVQAVRIEAAATENRLRSKISTLERELLGSFGSGGIVEGDRRRAPDVSKLENERNALKDMNDSLQEQVSGLKDRCRELETKYDERYELVDRVKALEEDLLKERVINSSLEDEVETVRSESLISQSKLQTKVAKIERDLLDAVNAKEAAEKAANQSEAKDSDLARMTEERDSIHSMNSSLQEHIEALKEKCRKYETSLDNAAFQTDRLGDEIDALKVKLRDKQKDSERKDAKIKQIEARAKEETNERQKELQLEVSRLVSKMKELSENNEQELRTAEKTQKEYREMAESQGLEIRSLNKQRADLEDEIHDLREQNKDLKNESKGLTRESKDLKNEVTDLRAKNMDFKGEIRDLGIETKDLKGEVKALKEKNSDLEEELRELGIDIKSKSSDLEGEIKLKKKISLLEDEVKDLTEYGDDLKALNKDLKAETKDLRAKNSDLEDAINQLRLKERHLRNEVTSLEQSLEVANTNLNESLSNAQTEAMANNHHRDAGAERVHWENALEEMGESKFMLEEENERLQYEIKQLHSQQHNNALEEMGESKFMLEEENERLQFEIKQLQAQQHSMQEELRSVENWEEQVSVREVRDLEIQIDELNEIIANLKQDLDESREKELIGEELAEQVDKLSKQADKYRHIIEELNNQLKTQKAEHDEKLRTQQTEVSTRDMRLKEMSKRIEIYRRQLEDMASAPTEDGRIIEQVRGQALMFQSQLEELKEKFDLVREQNTKLRSIISNNNERYIEKVEAISKELYDIEQVNESYSEAVRDLTSENEQLREGQRGEYQKEIEALSKRMNRVSSFLVAVSTLQKQQGSPRKYIPGKAALTFNQREDILSEELSKLEEELLVESHKSREEILHSAYHYGRELRTGIYNIGDSISRQEQEMGEISRALDNIQRE